MKYEIIKVNCYDEIFKLYKNNDFISCVRFLNNLKIIGNLKAEFLRNDSILKVKDENNNILATYYILENKK